MPLYEYKAVSDQGKKYTATLDAESLQEAKIKLFRRQVSVLQIEPLLEKKIREKLSRSELLTLTREMARLLQAGLPLFETLSALEEKYRGQKAHKLLLNLCDLVRSGLSLSQSLTKHPETFDLLYVSMVANAEKTGRLNQALTELSEWIAKQQEVRKQLLAALLYPALLSAFCLVVLSSLLFYVIPSLKELFEGRDLHPFTQIVFAASRWACQAKIPLALFLSLLIAGIFFAKLSPKVREKMAPLVFRLPLLKNLLAKVAFVRFCRASATLLEGGLPLVQSFDQARRVMRHPALEAIIAQAQEKIAQGQPIHAPFQNHPLIPPLVPRMLGIAEEGGKLPFMLGQIAQIYEEDLERTLAQLSTVAQPLLLLVLGLIIGFVLLSVLLPLTDVSSFAAG